MSKNVDGINSGSLTWVLPQPSTRTREDASLSSSTVFAVAIRSAASPIDNPADIPDGTPEIFISATSSSLDIPPRW